MTRSIRLEAKAFTDHSLFLQPLQSFASSLFSIFSAPFQRPSSSALSEYPEEDSSQNKKQTVSDTDRDVDSSEDDFGQPHKAQHTITLTDAEASTLLSSPRKGKEVSLRI